MYDTVIIGRANEKNSLLNSEEFFAAAKKGDVKKIADVLEANIDPNLQDQEGCTALHWASALGKLEVVKLLLENGADINAQTKNGETALHSDFSKF